MHDIHRATLVLGQLQQMNIRLASHGCDQFQGYLFGYPMPTAQTTEWLASLPQRA